MDSIKQRAEEYAQRIKEEQEDAYIFTDAEVLVEEAYEAGAKEERQRLTAWYDPAQKTPSHTMLVLAKLNGHYHLCHWSSDIKRFIMPEGLVFSSKEIDAWRPIHENDFERKL